MPGAGEPSATVNHKQRIQCRFARFDFIRHMMARLSVMPSFPMGSLLSSSHVPAGSSQRYCRLKKAIKIFFVHYLRSRLRTTTMTQTEDIAEAASLTVVLIARMGEPWSVQTDT